jgi:hypothetical protein
MIRGHRVDAHRVAPDVGYGAPLGLGVRGWVEF